MIWNLKMRVSNCFGEVACNVQVTWNAMYMIRYMYMYIYTYTLYTCIFVYVNKTTKHAMIPSHWVPNSRCLHVVSQRHSYGRYSNTSAQLCTKSSTIFLNSSVCCWPPVFDLMMSLLIAFIYCKSIQHARPRNHHPSGKPGQRLIFLRNFCCPSLTLHAVLTPKHDLGGNPCHGESVLFPILPKHVEV